MTTIFELSPHGLPTISFSLSGRISQGYYIALDSLELNENNRREFIYSETRYGGKAISDKLNLTEITFACLIIAQDRPTMLDMSHALNLAVTNLKGGRLKYHPDGASMATFYEIEASSPPKVADISYNRWDDIPKEGERFVMEFEVTLMSAPIAHSEVFTTITPSQSTLNNHSGNTFDLTDIQGDVPAIVQLRLQNLNSGVLLNRCYVCSRSSILSELASTTVVFQAESGTAIGSWSSQSDVTRSGGSFRRCTLSMASWHGVRFALADIEDYTGLLAFFAIVKPSTTNVEARVAAYINTELIWYSTIVYSPEAANKWQVMYVGEHNFPPFSMSEDLTPSVSFAIEFRSTLGNPTLDFDFAQVMFSDESIQQFDAGVDRSYGISYGDKFFSERNLDDQRVVVVTSSANGFKYPAKNVYGTLGLTAIKDTRFMVLFERDNSGDMHLPADQLGVETKVMYRTTYPFD